MQNQGVALQQNVGDLALAIQTMRENKYILQEQINNEEEERERVQKELLILNNRLENINELLQKNENEKIELERTIQNTDETRIKILESYRSLLNVLQKESTHHLKN
ncbi:hypothetical protein PPERSA_04410 [Pseudocohnilembus persalinus]|uniref:Uncharacterized protein n=1 Tax=Pseudocohnilembus persalinus TaxID=266149 RepID=A0A0V0QQN6_PSEPJ|nr:hypothetical protein PPERSA_04410 [Pseudocohnilembus persalinus]|eukprot:KRX04595.1 hypothetical protein PPERSA_04410 [Pseudocohnilembus persalinus]